MQNVTTNLKNCEVLNNEIVQLHSQFICNKHWLVWFQSWALSVYFNFFNTKKLSVAFYIKLFWLGVCFLNRTGAEIGYYLDKKCNQKKCVLLKKFKKYLKCPALIKYLAMNFNELYPVFHFLQIFRFAFHFSPPFLMN